MASPSYTRPEAPTIRLAWRPAEAQGAARELLAAMLAPLDWDGVLDRTPLGAPTSPWLEARGLSVSLSHAAGMAACAVMAGGTVGLDVEALDPDVDLEAVARDRFDADTVAALALAPDPLDHFFRLWTLTEAALKALGVGFATETLVRVEVDPAEVREEPPAGLAWRVFEIDAGPSHRMAVVALAPAGTEPQLIVETAD